MDGLYTQPLMGFHQNFLDNCGMFAPNYLLKINWIKYAFGVWHGIEVSMDTTKAIKY